MREAGKITGMGFWMLLFVVSVLLLSSGPLRTRETDIVANIESIVPENGAYISPVWVEFHNGSFDLFDVGSLASLAVERIAENANFTEVSADFEVATGANEGMHYVIVPPEKYRIRPGPISHCLMQWWRV